MGSLRRLPLPVSLLLLLVLPTIAHAQNSGGAIYDPTVPSIESEPASPATHQSSPHQPKPSEPSKPGTESRPAIELEADEGVTESGPAPQAKPQQNKHPHPDSPHQPPREETNRTPAASHRQSSAAIEAEAPQKAGGGSSPVVPLLIAVSVLAAISIAVARHRLNR